MHVLTIKYPADHYSVEIHMLNPGEFFPGFGGKSSGLTVGKTASMVTRHLYVDGSVEDIERDIFAPSIWLAISRAINGDSNARATYIIPNGQKKEEERA